jgi:hypothetical protein
MEAVAIQFAESNGRSFHSEVPGLLLPHVCSSDCLRHSTALLPDNDPSTFHNNESLDLLREATEDPPQGSLRTVEIKTYPGFTEVPENVLERSFTVLIHLRHPLLRVCRHPAELEMLLD